MSQAAPRQGRNVDPAIVRPALRWVLIFATTVLLLSPSVQDSPGGWETALLLFFLGSNLALTLAPRSVRLSPRLDHIVMVADTFLLSMSLFLVGLDEGRLPIAFFLTLLLSVIGSDLPRLMVGATLIAGLYVYLTAGASGQGAGALLSRIPFLYAVALYYGEMAGQVRERHEQHRRAKRETEDLRAFLEVTAATNSTLDLRRILYTVTLRVARLVSALRCSILQIDGGSGQCSVVASSDAPEVSGLVLDLRKYPEVRRAIETRQAVVIHDVRREQLMHDVRETVERLGFESILVLPLLHGESLLGMLFLRAARDGRRFTSEEIASCQIVANASANAMRNAMLYDEVRLEARSRRDTARKLQNILDQFPDLICAMDVEGRLVEFSRGGEELLGLSRAEALGREWQSMFADPEARARLTRLQRDGEPLQNFETVARRADDTLRDVLLSASPLRDESGRLYGSVGIVKNISELKAARGHLIQAEKLTALGEVISGVAHELNNPLAGVLGYAQLLIRGSMEPGQQRAVERILESALRCQRIVHNLLAFSRRYPSEKQQAGLNGLIDKTLDLKEYELRVSNVRVVRDLQADLPQTMLDSNQIQQVLLNLINNAQYAIGSYRGQGTLIVMTRSVAGAIQVRVQDDGPGIPRENQPRIFDPFFTTKPVGEGTGLGLSISYGIMRDHGGRIWAESEPGRGSTLVLEFPIRCEAGESRTSGVSERAGLGAVPRDLRILVVDDEPIILDLLVDALSTGRHTVDTAGSGGEALRRMEHADYDLVLLDLRMPDMDGRQVFETIAARWPRLKERIVFASGDTVRPDTREFIETSGRPCVDKPFRLEALSALLADVVGRDTTELPATGTEGR